MKELRVRKMLPGKTGTGFYLVGDIGIIVTLVDGVVTYDTKKPYSGRRIGYSVINRNRLIEELEKGKVPNEGFDELVGMGDFELWPYTDWQEPLLREEIK
jgi:hypothetical protein